MDRTGLKGEFDFKFHYVPRAQIPPERKALPSRYSTPSRNSSE
jgi:hypothetical protein